MDWKKFFINVATGVTIAIFAGIVVWLVTKPAPSVEGVAYRVSTSTVFGGGQQRYTFFKVEVSNNGNAAATGVRIEVTDKNGGKLSDLQVTRSRSRPEVNIKSIDGIGLSAGIARFLPSERVTFAPLYMSSKVVEPSVIVKTDNGLSTQVIDSNADTEEPDRLQIYIALLTFAATAFGVRGFFKKIARRSRFRFHFPERNNSGFLLLHGGLLQQAVKVLREAIEKGDHGPLVFSNLAAATAGIGNIEEAKKLLEIAAPWAEDNHDKSVVQFNRSIVDFIEGNLDIAEQNMSEAIRDGDSIQLYLDRSAYCRELFASTPTLTKFFDQGSVAAPI